MSLLEKASLIVTPNAYKESILYSVVPNTTLGDMTVVRATTATRVNSSNLIENVAINVPRIDYTNGTCPSLLVEPQRTNLISSSNDFTNWANGGVTLTSNYATSPDGTLNATRYQGLSGLYLFISYAPTANLTHSVWVKSNTGINQNISFGGQTVSTFVVTNEWKRIDKSVIASETLTQITTFQTTDILIWGAQAEQGSYTTSYIPTLASTVTRNADVISNSNISNFVGVNEGTVAFDIQGYIQQDGVGQPFWGYMENGSKFICFYDDGVYTNINGTMTLLANLPNGISRFKVAYRWNASFISVFINGVKVNEIAKTVFYTPVYDIVDYTLPPANTVT